MIALLLHISGIDNVSGRWYGFWSGIGGDFGLLSIAAASVRRHNCHVPWCPRIGRHQVPGCGWLICSRHHQGPKPTAAAVAAATTPPEQP